MSSPWVSIVLAPVILAALALGGGWVMEALCHRARAEALRQGLAPEDREPLFRRWRGYDREAVHRNWAPLHLGEAAQEPARAAARTAEKRSYELDLVYPFVYGAGFAAGLLLCWAVVGRPFHPAWLLAPVALALVADWVENSTTLAQSAIYDAQLGGASLSAAAIRLASLATQAKLVFLSASLALWTGMVLWAITHTLGRR